MRLEATNAQLRDEILKYQRSEAEQQSAKPKATEGPWEFKEINLPWPLEHLRVAAPGECAQRVACGDWLSLFRNAAPYIAAFREGTVVVHIPSFILDEEYKESFKGLMEDVAFCALLGLKLVLVTSVEKRLWRRLCDIDAGRCKPRVGAAKVGNRMPGLSMDEEALRIAKQEAGFARVEVESALTAGFEKRTVTPVSGPGSSGGASPQAATASAGIFPVRGAVSVVSSTNFFTASPLGVRDGVDYGYAGVVRSVNTEALSKRLQDGDIVSITPLGASPSGEVFFVSSEELAATIAKKLRAIKLVYITHGQRLMDIRDKHVIAGIQLHEAQELLKDLQDENSPHWNNYTPEVRKSEWFEDFIRHLRHITSAVSSNGTSRGHLVDPIPGSLLQEFYTTDGSGTVVAKDVYQGLGQAGIGDAETIYNVLFEDAQLRDSDEMPTMESVEAGCASGEFFVWKRDEVVLGCGQLVAIGDPDSPGGPQSVAELRYLAVASGQNQTHALALYGYAERTAAVSGTKWLVITQDEDADRTAWYRDLGFRAPTAAERGALPNSHTVRAFASAHAEVHWSKANVLVQQLGREFAKEDAEKAMAAVAEDQRMWGGT